RMWRRRRGLSQLALATLAGTTPRHVSFIETGRSRPGRQMVLRLAQCMDLPARERNGLLAAAGLRPEFAAYAAREERPGPHRRAIEAILERHDPYPGCGLDPLGRVLLSNTGFRALWSGFENLTPEQSHDRFFGPGPMRQTIENWSELAWAWVDRQRLEAARTNDGRLRALARRALRHLDGIPRPASVPEDGALLISPRFRAGDRVIRTFVTVVRLESAQDIATSDVRVELVFPVDGAGDEFFRSLPGTDAAGHGGRPVPAT
ncbi:MAG: helix-turn-helix domain-containing protein, partial [Pseudomonadota bacterium]